MELVHIANATFSSLRINHSLENLASKTKLSGLLKSTRLVPRDQASPPVWTGSHHRTLRRGQAGEWWSQPGSNRRPSGCKPDALPAELWPLVYWPKSSRRFRRDPARLARSRERPFGRCAAPDPPGDFGETAHGSRGLGSGPSIAVPADRSSVVVGLGGVAPPTSPLSGVRSN